MSNDVISFLSPIYKGDIVQPATIKLGLCLINFLFFFSLYSYSKKKSRKLKYKQIVKLLSFIHSFIHSYKFILLISFIDSYKNMWTNGYYTYGNALQRDMQPSNWLNQNISSGLNSKSLAIRVKSPGILHCSADKSTQFFGLYYELRKPFVKKIAQ